MEMLGASRRSRGRVREVLVGANVQVGAGAPLVRARAARASRRRRRRRAGPIRRLARCRRRRRRAPALPRQPAATRWLMLGFDVEPARCERDRRRPARRLRRRARRRPGAVRAARTSCSRSSPTSARCSAASATTPIADGIAAAARRSTCFAYLRVARRARPRGCRRRSSTQLRRALAHYGVDGLERTPALEDALLPACSSPSSAPAAGAHGDRLPMLERRLDAGRRARRHVGERRSATLLDRLIAARRGPRPGARRPGARGALPLLRRAAARGGRASRVRRGRGAPRRARRDDPEPGPRAPRIARAGRVPAAARRRCSRARLRDAAAAPAAAAARGADPPLLPHPRARARSSVLELRGHALVSPAEYELDERTPRARRSRYVALRPSSAAAAAAAPADRRGAARRRATSWSTSTSERDGRSADADAAGAPTLRRCCTRRAAPVARAASGSSSASPGRRAGRGMSAVRALHLPAAAPDGYAEERLLSRAAPDDGQAAAPLAARELRASSGCPSAEDVYLFHGVARDNPQDERLFALAEVRDLTPVRDERRARRRAARARAHARARRWRRSARFQAHRAPEPPPALEPRAALRVAAARPQPGEIDRAGRARLAPDDRRARAREGASSAAACRDAGTARCATRVLRVRTPAGARAR